MEAVYLLDSVITWGKLALFRFDNKGDTVWTRIYNDSTTETGITVKVTRDKKYIVGGDWWNSGGDGFSTITLKKTDSLGNTIWQKTYHGASSHFRVGLSIDTCKDEGYIICATDGDTNYSYCGCRIFIMKTDSGGNSQWTKYITDPICAVYPQHILSLRDGSYLVCGEYEDSIRFNGEEQFAKLYLAKISTTGNVTWTKQYGEGSWNAAGIFSLKELPNGDIVACGSDGDGPRVIGCILKTDSNGNQKWLRYYEMLASYEQDYLNDIQLLPNGGFVAVGQTYGSTENIWVVKTDSLGCDTVGCNYPSGVSEVKGESEEVKVYPNPAKGSITIAYSIANTIQEANIILYDMVGNKVADWSLLPGTGANVVNENISSLAPGMYFYTIFEDNKVIQRNKLVIER